MLLKFTLFAAVIAASTFQNLAQAETKALPVVKSKVFFVSPKDGAAVASKVKVKFGLEGMKIRPATVDVNDKTAGHHHLIIDGKPIAEHTPVPTNDTHVHFGKGQTETEVTLTPGKHTLTLQFADGAHISYGEQMSATITVTVK